MSAKQRLSKLNSREDQSLSNKFHSKIRGDPTRADQVNQWVDQLSKKGYDLDEINWKIMAASPKLVVPKQEKTLFVLRPFKKYEPFKTVSMRENFCAGAGHLIADQTSYLGLTQKDKQRQTLMSVPMQSQKNHKSLQNRMALQEPNKIFYQETFEKLKLKFFPEKPLNNEEAKSITRKLSGQELSKIIVGETVIDFGKVFVNSHAYSFFKIKNNLRSTISVKLILSGPRRNRRRQGRGAARHVPAGANHPGGQAGAAADLRVVAGRQDREHEGLVRDQQLAHFQPEEWG